MIESEGKYYLYRHIRLDKNEPFYIGIGTKQNSKDPYSRSKDCHSKNNIWKKIVAKTDYEIEIILESNDNTFIEEKEKEFIKIYGRLCENNGGILSNIQNGGRNGVSYTHMKEIYCCNNKTHYSSIRDASLDLGVERASISRVLSGEFLSIRGYVFTYSEGDCNHKDTTNEWFPLIDEKYGYYISKQKGVKRVFIVQDDSGNIIGKKERFLKPVVRKENGSVQLTISHHNKRFNINLKKEYKNIFGIDWNNN